MYKCASSIRKEGQRVWINPIFYMSSFNNNKYTKSRGCDICDRIILMWCPPVIFRLRLFPFLAFTYLPFDRRRHYQPPLVVPNQIISIIGSSSLVIDAIIIHVSCCIYANWTPNVIMIAFIINTTHTRLPMIDDGLRLTLTMHHECRVRTAKCTAQSADSICMQNSCWLYFISVIYHFAWDLLSKTYKLHGCPGSFRRCVYELLICIQFACVLHLWFTVLCAYITFSIRQHSAFTCKRGCENAWEQIFRLVFISSVIQILGFSCSKFFANKNKPKNCHLSCFGISNTHRGAMLHWKSTIWNFVSPFSVVQCDWANPNKRMQSNWCQSTSDME